MIATFKSKPIIFALAIVLSLMGPIFQSAPIALAQSPCGIRTAPDCPPNGGHDGAGANIDKRLNTNWADPYVIYCVAGQLQIYKVDTHSRGNLLVTHPLSVLILLGDDSAIQDLGQGFTAQHTGNNVKLSGPNRFFLTFSYNECLQRAGLTLRGQVDFNCDGTPDIIQVGTPGNPPFVKVTDGKTSNLLLYFLAYDANFKGGVNFALGNFNGDCTPDIVTGPGTGAGPVVKVFDGRTGVNLKQWLAYNASFTGGVRVAVGDLSGDGYPDIVTGVGPGAAPHVKVFDGKTLATMSSFFAFSPTFTGGVFPSVYDFNGDGHSDIIVKAYPSGHVETKVFDGKTLAVLSDTIS